MALFLTLRIMYRVQCFTQTLRTEIKYCINIIQYPKSFLHITHRRKLGSECRVKNVQMRVNTSQQHFQSSTLVVDVGKNTDEKNEYILT